MQASRIPVELVAAAVLTLVGVALTAFGAFAQVGWTNAPGATAALVGGAWIGNVLARGDVPLLGQHATGSEGSEK